MKNFFIFDLDGTLLPCERYYQQRINTFWTFMDTELGPDNLTVLHVSKMVEEENKRIIDERKGFYEDIFALSLVHTYEALAHRAGARVKLSLRDKMHWLGMNVFDPANYRDTLFPGVIETLDLLLSEGEEIRLYTKGPERHQRMKLSVNDLDKYFPNPIITPQKNSDQFRQIIGDWDKTQVYKVGNSAKSDANPATAIGIRAIYIPREEWLYEGDQNGLLRKELIVKIPRITDFIPLYLRLKEWDTLNLAYQEHGSMQGRLL